MNRIIVILIVLGLGWCMATQNTEPTNKNGYLLHQQQNMLLIQKRVFRQTIISLSVMAELIAPK